MVAYGINALFPVAVSDGGTGETTAAAGLAALGGLGQVAATAAAGFALENATPTILSWKAPADGQVHRVMLTTALDVTAAETGGQITLQTVLPNGTAANPVAYPGGAAIGLGQYATERLVESGSTVSLVQSSALTAGAAVLWAQIWAV